jgi:16S rRNA (adenine1518-N6/adenine1519-N6)-dimethyltransferase
VHLERSGNLLEQCRELLIKYRIKPKRKLGQNFLVSRKALDLIVEALKPQPGDLVYEVGAGLGTLTREVAARGAYTIAVEIDSRLVQALRDRFRGDSLVNVVHSDALKLPVPRVEKVVSNVPYSISSKLLLKLLREQNYKMAVLTLQREFALRLAAEPGSADYGRLSVAAQLYADIEIVGSVSRKAFYPQPEVDSLIVRLRPRGEHLDLFGDVERLTAALFSQRRRKLAKAARNAGIDPRLFEGIVDPEKRVYELTPFEVLEIARTLRLATLL